MTHLLDTCVLIALIRRSTPSLQSKVREYQPGDLCISSITEAELRDGADKSGNPIKHHQLLDQMLLTLPVLPFEREAARSYGQVCSALEKTGTPIGSLDMLIGAHALSLNLTLVTYNTSEFDRILRLQVEDWNFPPPEAAR